MIPVKNVTSVAVSKHNMLLSDVAVLSAGGTIPFRFRHDDAQAFKDALMAVILAPASSQQPVAAAAPVEPDVTDQISKLAELRDAGILDEAEFTAKKAQLLERM